MKSPSWSRRVLRHDRARRAGRRRRPRERRRRRRAAGERDAGVDRLRREVACSGSRSSPSSRSVRFAVDRGRAVDDLEVAGRRSPRTGGGGRSLAISLAGTAGLPVRREDQVPDVEHLVLRGVGLVEGRLDVGRQRRDRAEREADRVDVAVGEPRVAPARSRRLYSVPQLRAQPGVDASVAARP